MTAALNRPRRAAAAALVAAALGSLVTGGPVAAQPLPDAPGCERTSEEAPLLVDISTLAPRAPQRPDEPFQVRGTLVNCGREPMRDVQVRLGVGERLATRGEVARADEEPVAGSTVLTDGGDVELAPGGTRVFDLRLVTGELGLSRTVNGVWPLTVQGRARVGDEGVRGQVGLAHTFVPWFPDGPIAPTRVAWMLPLVDQPRRGPGEVMLDDELDALLEDDPNGRGRLQRALLSGTAGSAGGVCDATATPPEGVARASSAGCRAEAVPMTYALDPDLLYSVEAMTRGYTVLESGDPVDRPRSDNAEQWLVALRAAVTAGSDVVALPYGDPDVVALSRKDSPVKDDVTTLQRLGVTETSRLLVEGVEPLDELAWLPPGPVDRAVEQLAGSAVETVVLDAAALPDPDPFARSTPSARTTLSVGSGGVDALVVDDGLSRLLEPDPTAPGWQGERLAEQRWIAEVAALTGETPSLSRTIVVAPRRQADLQPALVLNAVADTGRLPFLCPVSLRTAAAGTERCAAGGIPDDQPPAPSTPRGAPRPLGPDDRLLDPRIVTAMGTVRDNADQFTDSVLIAGSEQAVAAKARLLRARGRVASTAWRDRAGGARLLELLDLDLNGLRSKVRLLNSQPVLLTGNAGTVSLTVENTLDQPVNVGVGLRTSDAARVDSEDADVQVVPPGSAVEVRVRVEARTSGRFEVPATLLDAEGVAFGPQVELQVRSTQYGRVALAITGVATAVLLVAAGVRITRRALRRGRPTAEPEVVPAAPGSGV